MKRTALLLLSAFSLQLSAFAQGPLTPPGPPAPTFKTLQEVEPRTPITNATGLTIGTPGSYYLTTNITVASGDGILIAVANVTLDLNGFTILSTTNPASGLGIRVTQHDVTILNGHIVGGVTNSGPGVYGGSGFLTGIGWFGVGLPNTRISGVTISGCHFGINLPKGSPTVVQACAMQSIGFYGITAGAVSDTTVSDSGDTGISADTASNCRGATSGPGAGITANVANNCYGTSSGSGTGVVAVTAINCSGTSSNGPGLYAESASNCHGKSSLGLGLVATNAVNCIGITTGTYGLYANIATDCAGSATTGNGIVADIAINCRGNCNGSGFGINASTAIHSYGINSGSGVGLNAANMAIGCVGFSSTGTGLTTYIANSCVATPISYTYHYNMPPSPQTP